MSWNFLGYDVGGGNNAAGADANICENYWQSHHDSGQHATRPAYISVRQ